MCINKQKNKGVALIIVLWMLSLLTILAAGYSNTMRTETKLTSNLVKSTQAKALAEAGIWQGITELLRPTSEQIWIADGSTYTFNFEENEIKIRLFDETGKIDLNTARPELIQGLIETVENINYDDSSAITDAILDWRDKDSLTRINGAEDEDYARLDYGYGAKDGTFNTLDELQQVMGMTASIYNKIKPAITIYSRKPTINKQMAPREVLLALPEMSAESVDNFIETRSSFSESDTLIAADLKRRASTAGKTFTIYSEAIKGKTKAHVSAVILLKKNKDMPYSVLSWQEDQVFESIGNTVDTEEDS
jgi:general secretion pathway protein K